MTGSLLDLTQLKPGETSEPVSLPFTVTNSSSMPVAASFLLGRNLRRRMSCLHILITSSARQHGETLTEIVLNAGQELRCSLYVKGIREGFEPSAFETYDYADADFSISVAARPDQRTG